MTHKHTLFVGIAFLAFSVLFLTLSTPSKSLGSAPSGLVATVATSSLMQVGSTSPVTLLATSTCTARIITTYSVPITLTHSNNLGKSPTATFGHLQAASTTVVYDSGLYGCGLVKAYGFEASAAVASTSITVTETR